MKYAVVMESPLSRKELEGILAAQASVATVEAIEELYQIDLIIDGEFYDEINVMALNETEAIEKAAEIIVPRAYNLANGQLLLGAEVDPQDLRIQ